MKKRELKIINPRLQKVDSKYQFAKNYRKKAHLAHAYMSASIAIGAAQVKAITSTSILNNPFKAMGMANAVINAYESADKAYKSIMGDKPYSFCEVYIQRMKRING